MSKPTATVSFGDALRVWIRVALQSFGGPTAQIAVMHRILVDEKKWISETRFLHALHYCMLLPGPEAQQLATYIGWLLHGTRGGLVAGGLFVLPGYISIMAFSVAFVFWQGSTAWTALLFGLKAACVVVVAEAVLRIARRVLKTRLAWAIAATSFAAIYFLALPFPLIIVSAALVGFGVGKFAPALLPRVTPNKAQEKDEALPAADLAAERKAPVTWRGTLGHLVCWLTLWFAPVAAVWCWLGPDHVFTVEGLFFSKAAVVTFGGAYAVLPYVAQQAVEKYQWLTPPEMLEGLSLAETTPGPLIIVLQFVGFLGAYRNPGDFSPLTAGVLGGSLTTWVTFMPSFLWIFVGAPYVERVRKIAWLNAALSAITAAVVGVVLNLAVWFALHALFGVVHSMSAGSLHWQQPEWRTLQVDSLVIVGFAAWLLLKQKRGMLLTLFVCALMGLAWRLWR